MIERNKITNKLNIEEVKEGDLKSFNFNFRVDNSFPFTELHISPDRSNLQSVENTEMNSLLFAKVKDTLKNRRKYRASCVHKILTFIPSCM